MKATNYYKNIIIQGHALRRACLQPTTNTADAESDGAAPTLDAAESTSPLALFAATSTVLTSAEMLAEEEAARAFSVASSCQSTETRAPMLLDKAVRSAATYGTKGEGGAPPGHAPPALAVTHVVRHRTHGSCGHMTHDSCSHVVIGPMAHVVIGPMTHVVIGPMAHVVIGPMTHAVIGPMAHVVIGPMAH